MALLNVVTEQAESRFGDLDEAAQQMAGAGIAQLRAAIKDYTDMLQTEAYPAIDEYSGRMAQFVRESTPGTEEYVNRVIAAIEALSSGIGRSVESYQASMAGLNSVNEQAMALVQTLDLAAMTTEQYTQLMRVLAEVAPDVAAALARQEEELAQQTLATLELQRAQAREIEQEKALARQMGTQNEVLARLARQYRIGRRDVQQYGGSLTSLARIMSITAKSGVDLLEVITEVNEKVRVTGHVWQGAKPHGFGEQIDDVTASVDKLGESLESTLESLLSFTRPFDMTKYLDETGQHIDTWDENLSRAEALLGDTAKAMQEPWFPEWAEMTGLPEGMVDPAQVKQFAVDFIDAFQRFDPSTWGAIKWDALTRSYERALSTDVNFQALLDYAQDQMELAGLGPESELVQKAFGFDTEGASRTAAQDYGTTFGETLVAVLPAEGERGIKAYKSGLLTGADDPNFRDELRKKLMPEARSIVVDVVREMLGSGAIP